MLGIDPAYRTRLQAVVDPHWQTPGDRRNLPDTAQTKSDSQAPNQRTVAKHGIDVIAIGNSTASRETTELIGELTQVEA